MTQLLLGTKGDGAGTGGRGQASTRDHRITQTDTSHTVHGQTTHRKTVRKLVVSQSPRSPPYTTTPWGSPAVSTWSPSAAPLLALLSRG